MGVFEVIVAALKAIPVIAEAIKKLVEVTGNLLEEQRQVRLIQEFEAARKVSRETGNTSELERLLGRPILK